MFPNSSTRHIELAGTAAVPFRAHAMLRNATEGVPYSVKTRDIAIGGSIRAIHLAT